MNAFATTAREWMRSWMSMLDVIAPGWRQMYDFDAIEQAIVDVDEGEGLVRCDGRRLNAVAEFILRKDIDQEFLALGTKSLQQSPKFLQAAHDFEELFRRDLAAVHRIQLSPDDLRRARGMVTQELLFAVLEPLARRLRQLERAARRREDRITRRHPGMPHPELVADARSNEPEIEVLGQESARRVISQLSAEVTPEALGAIRDFYLNPEVPTACSAAQRHGISPATMTRALQRLRRIARAELQGCPANLEHAFTAQFAKVMGG